MAGPTKEILEIGADTQERVVGAASCPPLDPLGIPLAGISEARLGFHFARINPRIVQVLACISGEGEVMVDGEWRRCGAGMAYITPGGSPHAYRALPGGIWTLAWVHRWASRINYNLPPLLKPVDVKPLESAILGMYRESHGVNEPAVVASWAHLIDVTARRMLGTPIHDARLSTLWEAVDAELALPWTLEEMARRSHVSPEHLRRLCNATFGRSPLRHLAYLRLRRGAELLASSRAKIEVVARLVGYDSAFAFSAAFKREIGVPPSKYR